MALTAYQRSNLEHWRLMREHGPTWPFMISRYRRHWLIAAVWCGVMSWLLPAGWPAFVGLTLGFWARDVGHIRSAQSAWPALATVVDWDRLEEVLEAE